MASSERKVSMADHLRAIGWNNELVAPAAPVITIGSIVTPAKDDEDRKKRYETLDDCITPDQAQQLTEFQKNWAYYFGKPPRDEAESDEDYALRTAAFRETYYTNAMIDQSEGFAMDGTYFAKDGHRLVPDESSGFKIKERLAFKMDNHILHFHMFITGKPTRALNIPEPAEKLMDEHAGVPLEDAAKEPRSKEFKDLKIAGRAYGERDESSRSVCRLLVHCKSFREAICIDLAAKEHDAEETEYMQKLPNSIVEHAAKMIQANAHPYLIEIHYDYETISCYRVAYGTPSWAQDWSKAAKTGLMAIVVDGGPLTYGRFDMLRRILLRDADSHPMDRFYHLQNGKHILKPQMMVRSIAHQEDYAYKIHTHFFDLLEYLTVMAVYTIQERREVLKDLERYGNKPFHIKLAKIANAGDRAYLAWLPARDETLARLSKGTPVEVKFKSQWHIEAHKADDKAQGPKAALEVDSEEGEVEDEDKEEGGELKPEIWRARVASEVVSCGPCDFVPMTISRPYEGDPPMFSQEHVFTIKSSYVDSAAIPDAILKDHGNEVKIRVAPQFKTNKAQLNAMDSLLRPGKFPLTPWNERCIVAAVGSKLETLTPMDIYQDLRKEFKDVTTLMELNDEQKDFIRGMVMADGGFMCCQGPPGTGKTRLAIEAAKPHIMSENFHQVLFLTSSNIGVNSTAEKLNKAILDLESKDMLKRKGVYALRLYSAVSEKSIREANINKTADTQRKRPDNIQGSIDWDELDVATAIYTQQYLEETKPLHEGKYSQVRDKRVAFPEMSAAAKMLEITGVIKGPHTDPDDTKWDRFREEFGKYARGVHRDEQAFGPLVLRAMNHTIANATVLVATTDYAGLSCIIGVIEKTLELIIADEAPREREVSYIPFFAARLTKIRGFLLMGDWLQLKPIVTRMPPESIFGKQMELSFMHRLINNGFKSYKLTRQYRMNEELCDMINKLTYDNALVTDESALFKNRPLSKAFAKWAQQFIGHAVCKLLIDVKEGAANQTMSTNTKSRYNDLYVILMISVADALLNLHPKAKVALVSAYSAHTARTAQAAQTLKACKKHLFQDDPNRLIATTVDGVQGEEYDFVVNCVLTTPEGGLGHQSDPRRCNVADSRAKHGYVCFTTVKYIKDLSTTKLNYVGRFVNHMNKNFRISHDETLTLPNCQFYRVKTFTKKTPKGII